MEGGKGGRETGREVAIEGEGRKGWRERGSEGWSRRDIALDSLL